ncbi:hypothetical protein H0H92_001450 [Tricholoma furcatifolium]|nr:hypothetical protein H0H92_001450 [Tricholoma furcatifolium]
MSEPHALSQLIVNGDKTSELLTFPYIDKDGLLARQYSDPFEYLMGMERGTLYERTVASQPDDLSRTPKSQGLIVETKTLLGIGAIG